MGGVVLHASSPILAALFPLLDRSGFDGRALICAYAAGFEAGVRSGRTAPGHHKGGWHLSRAVRQARLVAGPQLVQDRLDRGAVLRMVAVRGVHHLNEHVGAVDHLVGVLVLGGTPQNQCHGAGVVHAELGLQAVHRLFLACELEHQRVHADCHAFDVARLQAMRIAQLHAGIDAGVDHDAAGKGLVGVEADFKALAQFVGGL